MYLFRIAISTACILALGPAEDKSTDRFDRVVTRMVRAINAEDHAAIQADFGDVMLKAFPLEKQRTFFQNLSAGAGKITKWIMLNLFLNGYPVAMRT